MSCAYAYIVIHRYIIYICIYIYLHIHINTTSYIHVYACTYIYIDMCIHMYIHTYAHILMYAHMKTESFTIACIRTSVAGKVVIGEVETDSAQQKNTNNMVVMGSAFPCIGTSASPGLRHPGCVLDVLHATWKQDCRPQDPGVSTKLDPAPSVAVGMPDAGFLVAKP